MLEILVNWGNPLRSIAVMIDSVVFSLIDNAYDLIVTFSTGSLFKVELIQTVMNNTYVIIGIFALFRIALLLVNAMINPDKLNEKGNGIGNVLGNLIIMFVLLIMTPILFREIVTGYTKSDGTVVKGLQQTIVEGNYIQKIFLNMPDKGWGDSSLNPGSTMRTIAASSLITIDDNVRKSPNCTGKCEDAVKEYDEMVKKNNFKFSVIAKYVSYQIEVDGEDTYIYNYKTFITFAAGIAITYILLNFALKLALRMVELTVLEMIAPLFIATYIDPKSAKSGPFNKWLKNVGSTFASLFIDIAIISLMILFISLLGNSGGLSSELKGFSKIVMLFAILIFAKKAPKWITSMIGIEGNGFKGIGKTIKEDMLGGSLANKAALGATAIGAAAIGNRLANARHEKKLREAAGLDGRKNKHEKRKTLLENGYTDSEGNRYTGKGAYTAYKKDNGLGLRQKLSRNATALGNAIVSGGKAGVNGTNIKGAIEGGIKATGAFVNAKSLPEKGIIGNIKDSVGTSLGKIGKYGYGNENEIYDRRKKIQDAKNAEFHSGGKYGAGLGENNIVEGNGDAVKMFKKYGVSKPGEELLAQYCETNGMDKAKFNTLKGGITKTDDGRTVCNIDGKDVDLAKSLYVSGTGGAENLQKMFNSYQTNALANYSHSQEQYAQQAGAYQGMLNSQSDLAKNAQAIATALSSSLPSSISNALKSEGIKLDTSSMSGVKNSIKSINDHFDLASNEEQKLLSQKLSELSKLSQDYDFSEKQTEIIKKTMEQLQGTCAELKPIIDGIEGNTTTEKEQKLSIGLSKLEKTLEGIKKPEGNDS